MTAGIAGDASCVDIWKCHGVVYFEYRYDRISNGMQLLYIAVIWTHLVSKAIISCWCWLCFGQKMWE